MMGMTPQQAKLLRFVQNRIDEDGVCPSYVEIAQHVGIVSKSGVHRMVTALEDRGIIRRKASSQRSLEIIKRIPDSTSTVHQPSYNSGYDQGHFDGFQAGVDQGHGTGIDWALKKLGLPIDHLDKFKNEISES